MIRTGWKSLIRAVVRTWWKYLGYTVTVWNSDDSAADNMFAVHYCGSWQDALEWVACYSAEYDCVVSQYGSTQVCVRYCHDV